MVPKATFSLPSGESTVLFVLSISLPVPNIIENGDADKSLLAPKIRLLPEISTIFDPSPRLSKYGLMLIIELGVSIFKKFALPIIIVLLQSYVCPISPVVLEGETVSLVKSIIEFVAAVGSKGMEELLVHNMLGTVSTDCISINP